MIRYLAFRMLSAVPTLIGVVAVTFFLLRALPGDPAVILLGEFATAESLAALRAELNLDRPVVAQFAEYVRGIVTLDFGTSAITKQPVLDILRPAILPSLYLAVAGVAFATLIGVPAGVTSAVRQGSWVDYSVMLFTIGGISFPVFWVGLVAIVTISANFAYFPATGSGVVGDVASTVRHLILPAIVLGFAVAAYIARLTRSAMLEVLRQSYVTAAESLGIPRRQVIMRFALRNALAPILGVIGVSFAWAIGNAILVEFVFARSGLGSLILRAVSSRDYQLVQAGVLVLAISVVIVNTLLDMLNSAVDPRVRASTMGGG